MTNWPGPDNLPPVTVTKEMVLVDSFHRLEAAKRRRSAILPSETGFTPAADSLIGIVGW
jgi:hypothetical protein